MCQGSMRAPGKLCLEAMKGWETAFFESEFTHAAIGARLTSHPEGFLGLWRDLAGSEGEFPGEFLVKSGDSLHGFVQGGRTGCAPFIPTCFGGPLRSRWSVAAARAARLSADCHILARR